jgi:hypothetical protein
MVATNTSCSLSVRFAPTAPGAASAHVLILSDAPTSPDRVTLVGTATPPSPIGSPALSALRVSPRSVAISGRLSHGRCERLTGANRDHRSCTRPIALRVEYTLTLPASVTLTIQRTLPGRTTRGRCVALTHANRRHRPCVRLSAVPGSLARTGAAGANRFVFNGRIGGHTLGAGTYRLTATPHAAGRAGKPVSAAFSIVR